MKTRKIYPLDTDALNIQLCHPKWDGRIIYLLLKGARWCNPAGVGDKLSRPVTLYIGQVDKYIPRCKSLLSDKIHC